MGLFRRNAARRRAEVAAALAARGVSGRATVVALRPTGVARDDGAVELELTLDVEAPGRAPQRVVHRQLMGRFLRHGLAPGEPALILYDRDDPRTLLVRGHPRVRSEIVDGELVVVEEAPLQAPRR